MSRPNISTAPSHAAYLAAKTAYQASPSKATKETLENCMNACQDELKYPLYMRVGRNAD